MLKNTTLEHFLTIEKKWFTKKGSPEQKEIDKILTKMYTKKLSTFFRDSLSTTSVEDKATNIILADQISRHVFRSNPDTQKIFTQWAYKEACNFIKFNSDKDDKVPFWVKLFILLAIRHSGLQQDLIFCRDRVNLFNKNKIRSS